MMNNSNNKFGFFELVLNYIVYFLMVFANVFYATFFFVANFFFSILYALYSVFSRFFYSSNYTPFKPISSDSFSSLIDIFGSTIYQYFFFYSQILFNFKIFKNFIYFFFFIVGYFYLLGVELSNESLLLFCIFLTMFFVYSSVRDIIVSSIEADVILTKKLLEKKLALLNDIYILEQEIYTQNALTLEVLEVTLACLFALEDEASALDELHFENLINSAFSDSLFNYFVVETRDDFFMDYFTIEDQFEDTLNTYLETNFVADLC